MGTAVRAGALVMKPFTPGLVGEDLWSRLVCSPAYTGYYSVDGWLRLRVGGYVEGPVGEQIWQEAGKDRRTRLVAGRPVRRDLYRDRTGYDIGYEKVPDEIAGALTSREVNVVLMGVYAQMMRTLKERR